MLRDDFYIVYRRMKIPPGNQPKFVAPTFTFRNPYSLFGGSIHYKPDGEGDAPPAGEGEGDGGEKPPPKKPDMSYRDAQKLIRQRDSAKKVNQAVCEALGLEPEWVEDDENPGKKKLLIKGLDRITTALNGGEKPKWEDKKNELEEIHNRKVKALKTSHDAKVGGLTSIINDLAVVAPLRAALAAEGAYDDGEGDEAGQFNDLVTLLRPRMRTELEQDEETGDMSLSVVVLDATGKPLLDKAGDPVTPRQFVKDWLEKKPQYRKADFRRGPGAGGRGDPNQYGSRGRGAPSVEDHARETAAALFGVSTK